MVTLLVLIMATLENYFLAERNCWTQNVHLEVTFSARNVPSGEERGEKDVFPGYGLSGYEWIC